MGQSPVQEAGVVGKPLSVAELQVHAEAERQGIAPPMVDCECTGYACAREEDKIALLEGRHHPNCPTLAVAPPVEEVLGDVSDPEAPTDEELAAARAILARAKKAKPRGTCPGDGCGRMIQPNETVCHGCLTKQATCVRCGKDPSLRGPFLCPLCVAQGHRHCVLCMRPPMKGSPMCEVCDADSRKANLSGGGVPVADSIPKPTDTETAAMLTPQIDRAQEQRIEAMRRRAGIG